MSCFSRRIDGCIINSAPKFGPLTVLCVSSAARRYLIRSLILLLFLGLVGGSAAASTDVQMAPVTSVGPGLPFAIADFDGDLCPDLASVQTGRSDFSHTDYWIQLHLTTTGHQSIQVVAGVGGLQIAARDVNGDHAVDLVLTSALLRQPVAILLNDGHGSFTRAAPTAFPGAFTESETNWASGSHQVTDAVGVPPQSRVELFLKMRGLPYPKAQEDFTPISIGGLFLRTFLTSHLGRAPPSQGSRL
jgi:hypothetical protein